MNALTDDDIADAAHQFQQDNLANLGGVDQCWFERIAGAAMRKALALAERKRAEELPTAEPRKAWPEGPVKAEQAEGGHFGVRDAEGTGFGYKSTKREAEAIELALNEFPACVAALTESVEHWHHGQGWGLAVTRFIQNRDAILARVDAAGFALPRE